MTKFDHVKTTHTDKKAEPAAATHANTDPFDSRKGKGSQFRIHKRRERNDDIDAPVVGADNQLYVWHGNNRHLRLRVKVATTVAIAAMIGFSIGMVTVNRSAIIAAAAAYTDGRIFSKVMEIDPDLVAAVLNEINTSEN